jgi:hypothetical protein
MIAKTDRLWVSRNEDDGSIWTPTGRGAFADISKVSLDELLERYDAAAAFPGAVSLTDAPRTSVIEAYHRAERMRARG